MGCSEKDCKCKRPTYNYKGTTKGIRCGKHKLVGMIDVKNPTCIYEGGCTSIKPCFNFENEIKGIYCSKHKLNNMVDVINKKCAELDCKIRPSYNYITEKNGVYCSNHKLKDMVNVISSSCSKLGCKSISPCFNYKNEIKGIFCSTHKLKDMIDIIHKTCIEENCNKIPVYNDKNEKLGIYCLKHKKNEMIDVRHKVCKNEWCDVQVKKKYKGYCLNCFIHEFPNEKIARNYKTKDTYITNYIKEKFENYDLVCDKKIQDGCSRRRPDILLDLGNQVIIVEIDENQHQSYDCSCENKRLMELSQDLGHRPIVFIRFNPDDYKDGDEKITSCFGLNKLGLCIVKKTKQIELNERLNNLKEQIEYWIKNQTDKMVETIQLYYDK